MDMYHLVDKYSPFPENEGPPKILPHEMAVLPDEKNHALSTGSTPKASSGS